MSAAPSHLPHKSTARLYAHEFGIWLVFADSCGPVVPSAISEMIPISFNDDTIFVTVDLSKFKELAISTRLIPFFCHIKRRIRETFISDNELIDFIYQLS